MLVWSQSSAHPRDFSSTNGATASSARPDPSGVDALADLAALLADPAGKAWALSAVPGGLDNEAVKRDSGLASDLLRTADPTWAVVVRPAPELLVLDLDECADLVLPGLCASADEAATPIVAIVASGRPNSRHLWLAPPTTSARSKIIADARWLRETHHLSPSAVDDRSGTTIRVPGSAPLKASGGWAAVVDLDGREVIPTQALQAARTAIDSVQLPNLLRALNLPSTPLPAQPKAHRPWPRPARKTSPRESVGTRFQQTPPLPLPGVEMARPCVEQPRAWRRRTAITAAEWAVLNDATSDDRSAAATAAAWVLFRHGIRSFALARWWYENLPAFDKFRHRDETKSTADKAANQWSSSRQHWETIRDRGVNHRLPLPPEDERALAAARADARSLDGPLIQAAALVIIEHRFATGHGLTDRPIARRDLQRWLHLADGTAAIVMRRLVDAGFITVAVMHDPRSGARQATTYNLSQRSTPVDYAHDVTTSRELTLLMHPLWGTLGHHARLAWTHLSTSPTPLSTRDLATLLDLPLGDHKSGTLHLLRQLSALGAIQAQGSGRWRRWSTSGDPRLLDTAAEASGAAERARELDARINAERAAYHAETRSEASRAVRGLSVLRSRLHHADAIGSTTRPASARPAPRPRQVGPGHRRASGIPHRGPPELSR